LIVWRGPSANNNRFHSAGLVSSAIPQGLQDEPLKVKKMKKAKSSFFLVESLMWQKKQK
jgi:hypothetical protein